jgi:DNA-binding transcriptional regulator WhiA
MAASGSVLVELTGGANSRKVVQMKDPENEKELERIRKRADELRRIRSEQPRLSLEEGQKYLREMATQAGLKHPIKYPG